MIAQTAIAAGIVTCGSVGKKEASFRWIDPTEQSGRMPRMSAAPQARQLAASAPR
jgi:hypothetical protein